MTLPPPFPMSLLYRAPRGLANMLSAAAVAGDRHRIASALRLGRKHCARDVARDLRCYVHWIGPQRRSCPAPFACRPGESCLRPFDHTRAGREYLAAHPD